MPCTKLEDADFTDGRIDILAVLTKTGIAKSRSEARKLCEQNGVSVNDVKVTDTYTSYSKDELASSPIIVKKGKKIFHKVEA